MRRAHDPLDLRGPEFLVFYVAVAFVVLLVYLAWRWLSDRGGAPFRPILMAQAFRMVSAARLLVLRGAVSQLVTVRQRSLRGTGFHLARAVAAVISRTLQIELEIPRVRLAAGVPPPAEPATWPADAGSRTA